MVEVHYYVRSVRKISELLIIWVLRLIIRFLSKVPLS